MTDRIDLDERIDDTTEAQEQDGHPDDWIWRDDGAAPADATPPTDDGTDSRSASPADSTTDGQPPNPTAGETADSSAAKDADTTDESSERGARSIPHVPHPDKGKPAGIPVERGGSGGGTGTNTRSNSDSGGGGGMESNGAEGESAGDQAASGPHGGGADDMTMAFTFEAIQRVANPVAVLADAGRWTDWIGIVGDVDAHVLNKFQRDHGLDVDFFNGTGTGPGERLAEIGPHSMFFADRMVVVGIDGEDEHIADAAGWEFVPLGTAAGEADWALVDD